LKRNKVTQARSTEAKAAAAAKGEAEKTPLEFPTSKIAGTSY